MTLPLVCRRSGERDPPRVVIALDLDSFYANAMLRLPEHAGVQGKPVGIVQKHLVVTTNREARARGVPKMSPKAVAKAKCPEIVFIDGSDLSPFRAAAREVRETIRNCIPPGTPMEYLGLDEVFLDATGLVSASGGPCGGFSGHVVGPPSSSDRATYALQQGSRIAAELRAAVHASMKLPMCAGIAESKTAAKVAAGIHKPFQQTTFLSAEAFATHISGKPPRAVPGFGWNYAQRLEAWATARCSEGMAVDVSTVGQTLKAFEGPDGAKRLVPALQCTSAYASWLLATFRGTDDSPVKMSGPPSSISTEDGVRGCVDYDDACKRMRYQCNELVERLADDAEEHGNRSPRTLTVKFRRTGAPHRAAVHKSMPIPVSIRSPGVRGRRKQAALDRATDDILACAMRVLGEHGVARNGPPFSLSLLGVGANNFSDLAAPARSRPHDVSPMGPANAVEIMHFFKNNGKRSRPPSQPPLDRQADACKDPPDESPPKKPKANEPRSERTCPVCDSPFSPLASPAMLSRHVDACLKRGGRPKHTPPRITKCNTKPVSSFFATVKGKRE